MIEDLPYDVVNGVPMTVWKGFKESKLYLVNTMAEWKAFYELLMKEKLVACDTETTGFDWFAGDKMVGMSFGWRDEHFYIPIRHVYSVLGGEPPPQIDMDDIREDLQAFFAQKDVFTIWHNNTFDRHFYEVDGIEVLTPFHDTLLLWHLFDENAPGKLKVIASGWRDIMGRWHKGLISKEANEKEKEVDRWRTAEAKARRKIYGKAVMDMADELQTEPKYQGWNRRDLKKHIQIEFLAGHPYQGVHKADIHYGYIPVPLMCEYAGMDTYMTWYIYKHVMKNMDWNQELKDLYINEIMLSTVLKETETGGTIIDKKCLVDLGKEFDEKIEVLEKSIKDMLGKTDINLGSGDQLACALVQNGVLLTKLTDSSTEDKPRFCTDKKVLDKVKDQHPAIPALLELNAMKTLNSTFVRGILDKIVGEDMLHCRFNQNVSTGRMSGREPNLMNIPRSDKSIRRAFIVPDPDYIFLFADYSQVEIRLTAHFSQDPLLLDAYANNQDIHTRTMCEMFGHDYDYVKNILDNDPTHPQYEFFSDLRSAIKPVVFGTIYGVGALGLSDQIVRPDDYKDATQAEWQQRCQELIDVYFHTYIGVKRFINAAKRIIRQDAIVYNTFGRPRRLPDVNVLKITKDESKKWMKAKAERKGVNFLIQGEAADVFKTAAVRVHKILKGSKSRLVNFVHDEVQIYMHKDDMHLLKPIKEAMEDFPQYSVPLLVDFGYSTTNWADKKGLKAA